MALQKLTYISFEKKQCMDKNIYEYLQTATSGIFRVCQGVKGVLCKAKSQV